MKKLGFTGMNGLDHLRSLTGSLPGTGKSTPISNPKASSSGVVSYGSFATLKLTAEKLVKEQASVKTDLEMAHMRLKKATDQIHVLEAKLQETVNENAKLKVKQTEECKLWNGLDSKLSSTKTLCDQLTETLQQLACQTCTAEEDKKFLEEKLSNYSKEFEDFNFRLNDLSTKLESAGNTIRTREQEVLEIRRVKDEMEKCFRDERCATECAIKEKGALIKQLEDAVENNKKHLHTVDTQLHGVQHELTLKEETCKCLRATQEVLEKEKHDLQCNKQDLEIQVDKLTKEIGRLEDLVHSLVTNIVELDKESSTVSNHVAKLFSSFETYYELVQQEKDLSVKCSRGILDKLQKQLSSATSENEAFKEEITVLKCKIAELQKAEEYIMVQHAEECRLAEDKFRRLQSEAEALNTKKNESEKLVADLEGNVKALSEAAGLTEKQMEDLLQKVSNLETENHNLEDKVQSVLQERTEETGTLKDEIAKRDEHAFSLQNQISQLQDALNEREQLYMSFLEREKQLDEEKSKIQISLAAAECKLTEERKQFDLLLEGKQLELSRHLKELSQRNDQAINVIRSKYEAEKVEVANMEKGKADKLIREMERKCDENISRRKEEEQQHLEHLMKEYGEMINKIQQDHNQKESSLQAHQKEELQRIQLQAETDLRERTSSLRKEHEIQIKSLTMQHEDDCKRLQEELEIQKSKEEKQRALLQLQWKVMGENQQVDQEANSKKEYSVSSIRMRNSHGGKDRLALTSPQTRRKDANLSGQIRSPMTNLLKKVEKGNTGSVANNHRKVTQHEYEVETTNGRTVTKRRKTKSTVMYGEPNTQKSVPKKTPDASKDKIMKVTGGKHHPNPGNLGDLFSEGSLDPYNDDPYAF